METLYCANIAEIQTIQSFHLPMPLCCMGITKKEERYRGYWSPKKLWRWQQCVYPQQKRGASTGGGVEGTPGCETGVCPGLE